MASLVIAVFICLLSHALGKELGVSKPIVESEPERVAANNCTTEGQNVNIYCHCDGKPSGKPVSCPTGSVGGPSSTKPQPPTALVAFSVGGTNRFAPGAVTRVPFNVVLYNDGRHFHTDNAFYAPYDGIYAFTFSAVCAANKWVELTLYTQKPGEGKVAVARASDYGGGGGYGAASGAVMLRLEPGETVSVWTESGHVIVGQTPPSTLFMGELKQRL